MALRDKALRFTQAAAAYLEGFQAAGFAFAAMRPVIDRAEEIARERRAPRIGRVHLEQALDELSQREETSIV